MRISYHFLFTIKDSNGLKVEPQEVLDTILISIGITSPRPNQQNRVQAILIPVDDPSKGTVSRDEYYFEGLNILIRYFLYALMVYKVFQKLFITLYKY